MYQLKNISYNSKEYHQSLELRNKVMRKPLGLNIYDEDFSNEKDCHIIGFFDNQTLLSVGVLSNHEDLYKVEYLCVDSSIQSNGLGRKMLDHLEDIARSNGGHKLHLEARVKAKPFYLRAGFTPVSKEYILDYAPVGHIKMEKEL